MAIKVDATLPLNPKRAKHHKIITKNMDYLCSHTTNLSKLTILLLSFEVIQLELRDEIMALGGELDQYCKLYAHVSRKNDDSFRHLLVALRKSGNNEVCRFLQESYESDIHNAETPEGFPNYRDSFSEVPPRKFKDIRKRDVLRFCLWGFGTVSLVIISVMLIVWHFQGSGSNNGGKLSTSIPGSLDNTTKINEVVVATHNNNGHTPTPPLLLPTTGVTDPKEDVTFKPGIPQDPNKFMSIQINSPFKAIPVVDDPETKTNITISPTKKYDWRTWQIPNPDQVYSLALKGSFNETDVHYFLRYFTNLRKLSISNGSYLCAEFMGNIAENEVAVEIHKRIDAIRISVVPECELMYKYLASFWQFPNLKTVVFERVFISVANSPFIHDFFSNHQKSLTRLFFLNVTLCDSCEIFKGILFSNLEEAKFIFFDGRSSSAAKTLRNFSEATPFMSRFHSNIDCPNVEPRILENNWKHLRSSMYDFCEDN